MVYDQLSKYLENYEPVLNRGSGFSAAKLKQLKELKILNLVKLPLKSGKMPASTNAFELTLFGRSVIREATNNSIPIGEVLNQVKSLIDELKADYNSLIFSIEKVNKKFSHIEEKINSIRIVSTQSSQKLKPNLNEILSILQDAERYSSSKQKLGPLISVDEYYKRMKKYTNITNQQINDILFELFQKGKLDLQQGPERGKTYVLSPSGKRFQWGKLKG